MKSPPYLLKVRFHNPDHTFGLWLPLFLIWPVVLAFLLAIFIILLPFAFLALIFTWRSDWFYYLLLSVPAVFRIFFQLPGLKVDVGRKQDQVHIEFI
jgi:phosphoglycerol transferase MdoB-like AlkP superfamily enzyme